MAIGLAPCALVLIRTVWSMLLLMFMGLPCCCGASMFCDGTNTPGFPGRLLHSVHDWVFLIGVYGFVRATQLMERNRKAQGIDEEL